MTTTLWTKTGSRARKPRESLLTIREVAEMLKVHPNTVRTWGKMGLIPVYRVGPRGDRRFRLQDVQNLLHRN
jgi:excisionase family DNA binding protein